MIGWYQAFFISVMVLWFFASPRDRMALRIVGIAAILSELMKYGITVHIAGAWKLVVFNGAGEALTMLALLKWAPNRTGYWQAACVLIALAVQLGNYVGIELGWITDYARYVIVIKAVALLQIIGFYDTAVYNLRRISLLMESSRHSRVDPLRAGIVRSRLLHDPHPSGLQTLPESRQAD